MNMIVCADSRWGIGKKGELLVRIPADQGMFREHTVGNVVLGGRKTMEGLRGKMPLNGRVNIVLTSKKGYTFGDAVIVHSMEEALLELKKYEEDRIYIIGGGKVYQEFLPYCNRVYVTKVDYQYEADTFFPNLDKSDEWVMTHDSEEQTYYDLEYYFTIYQRRDG